MSNAYVQLTRQIDDIHYYANKSSTRGKEELVSQLSREVDKGSSLRYMTEQEVYEKNKEQESMKERGMVGRLGNWLTRSIGSISSDITNNISDRLHVNDNYYNYEAVDKVTSIKSKSNLDLESIDSIEIENRELGNGRIKDNINTIDKNKNKKVNVRLHSEEATELDIAKSRIGVSNEGHRVDIENANSVDLERKDTNINAITSNNSIKNQTQNEDGANNEVQKEYTQKEIMEEIEQKMSYFREALQYANIEGEHEGVKDFKGNIHVSLETYIISISNDERVSHLIDYM